MSKKHIVLLALFAASTQVNAVGYWDWLVASKLLAKTIITEGVLKHIMTVDIDLTQPPTPSEKCGDFLLNGFSGKNDEIIRRKLERGEPVLKSSGPYIYR